MTQSRANCIGLIPAAGRGSRLGLPYPKELYPIIVDKHYKAVSEFTLEAMIAGGATHIAFVIDETKHQLIGYYRDGQRFACNISYVVQRTDSNRTQSLSAGLATALASANHLTRGRIVLFGMADTIILPTNVFEILLEAIRPEHSFALALFPAARPEKAGMVKIAADNSVLQVVDKPKVTSLRLGWGCMVWRPAFTEHLRTMVETEMETDFAAILNAGVARGLSGLGVPFIDGVYRDVGTYDELAAIPTDTALCAALRHSETVRGVLKHDNPSPISSSF